MSKFFPFKPTNPGQIVRMTRTTVELAANVSVTAGRPAVLSGGYYREPAVGVATLSGVRGRFTDTVSNVGGAAGAKTVQVDFYHEFQVIWLNNDTTDPVAKTDRGTQCYWTGPLTVGADSDSDANSVAGEVFDVSGNYVGVKLEA
ncbi:MULTISPECIES: hypothetical protein [Sorangium]|uniref:hypothetical protein n=1 Tax=Sorangium TaxID=39643 RepID=UPI003D9C3257